MKSQLMQLRTKESELSKKQREYKIKIVRIFHEISTFCNPYFDNIEEIKALEIEQAADELLVVTKEAIENEKKLKQIKKELGE